jgi:hypothetical protein
VTVEPDAFVAAMSRHWSDTLHNATSPALQAVWRQLAYTFNRQIAAHGTPEGQRWKVLQPATGTGKSQGLAVYCSMLPAEDHPGVLIVTRLKAQADEIAATINRLTGPDTALAYHGDNRVAVEELPLAPVLVITHRAYEIGMDAINQGRADASNWSRYHEWNGGQRKLTVIDEALDVIEEAQIDLNRVRFIRAVIPFDIAERFPEQMAAITFVEDLLTKMARIAKDREQKEQERVLWTGKLAMPVEFDMTGLRRELKAVRFDQRLLQRSDAEQNRKLIKHYDTIVRDIQATLGNWNWYAKKMAEHTINTARLIVPEDIAGAVILDATASANLIYRLFDYKVDIIPVPSNARNYANVTLHVSKGHAVGKGTMVRNAKDEAPKLVGGLKDAIGADRKVLVICHKAVEPHVAAYGNTFAALDVGHWNAIDGRNDWQQHDAVVIFGLPYRDKVWSANTFMALRGLQDTEWLNSDGDRPFENYRDVRQALEVGHIVVSVVQAINRVRCRRVVDQHGNCEPTDVFLLLPDDATGRAILSGIKVEMPGVNIEPWHYAKASGITRKPRKSNHGEALIRYVRIMQEGKRAAGEVMRDLGMSRRTFMNLVSDLKEQTSGLAMALAEAGVRYVTTGSLRISPPFRCRRR